MGFLGGQELLVILLILIVLFGAKKIPELASGLGKGIKEFKKASQDTDKEIENKGSEAKSTEVKPDPSKEVKS
jgi:sec-independent protein translocase protein TatA